MHNLIIRSITGLFFVLILITGILYSSLTYTLLFAVITGVTLIEFASNVNKYVQANVNILINSVAGVYLFVAFSAWCQGFLGSEVFIPYLISLLYILISELYLKHKDPLKNWAFAFASQLYIALPFSLLSTLAFIGTPTSSSFNSFTPILPLSIFLFLWASDSGAYCVGSALSRFFPAKLFPRISPNKSWVGSIGGGILCILVALILSYYYPHLLTIGQWIGLSITVCIFGTWGDLVESLFKRQLGIKDSGKILPGHGGMLDRFDSSLLAIPAAALYIYSLQHFAHFFI